MKWALPWRGHLTVWIKTHKRFTLAGQRQELGLLRCSAHANRFVLESSILLHDLCVLYMSSVSQKTSQLQSVNLQMKEKTSVFDVKRYKP